MRVAIFTDTFLPEVNGVARTLGRWVSYLESQGIPCKVFAPDHRNYDASNDRNIVERFFSIPFLLYPECKLAIPNPINIKKTLKEFQPTIIHSATPFNLGLYGMHYAKKNQIPFVASYHTNYDQYLAHYKIQWIESTYWKYMLWFHQECRKIYVPSLSTQEYLEERGMKGLEIWGRGIDMSRFHPRGDRERSLKKQGVDPNKFVVLYVGRIAPEKSIDVVIDAYQGLKDPIRQNAHLIMVGDGPLYKEMLEKHGSKADITFTGFLEGADLSELFAAADVFLFPSATETFGNVVLETMASGTPIIGAAAGGVKDNIRHMETGILCEPNRPEQYTDALETLYGNEDLRQSLADAARNYCMLQTWDSIFSRLLASYRDVLAQNRRDPIAAGVM